MATILLIYAALDELAQVPIPGRTGDIQDWIADAFGVCIGLLLHRLGLAFFEQMVTRATEQKRAERT
jgi:VanZ family protein